MIRHWRCALPGSNQDKQSGAKGYIPAIRLAQAGQIWKYSIIMSAHAAKTQLIPGLSLLFCACLGLAQSISPASGTEPGPGGSITCGPHSIASIGLRDAAEPERFLFFGEMHGTNEGPGLIKSLMCNLVQEGSSVALALEMSSDLNSVLEDYTAGDQRISDMQFLDNGFWKSPFQDGRRSMAMFSLIRFVKELRAAHPDIGLFGIDRPPENMADPELAASRDEYMASQITRIGNDTSYDKIIILVGNLHARTPSPSGAAQDTIRAFMETGRALSVRLAFAKGSAWVCTGGGPDNCSSLEIADYSQGLPAYRFIPPPAHLNDRYDGWILIPKATASPPAFNHLRPGMQTPEDAR